MRRIKLARVLQKVSDAIPRRYPVRSVAGLSQQPFFILGSGRNGSTLLNRMLNQHSQLFLPSEQYFLGNSIIKFKLYNFLIWRDLIKILVGELIPSSGSHTWYFGPDEVLDKLIETDDRSLQYLIDCIYRTYGKKAGVFTKWGDTTPLNTRYLPEIYSVFPKARYILLIRDPRDVMASYHAAGTEYLGDLADPSKALDHWVRSVLMFSWIQKKTTALLVRYEEMVRDPQTTLNAICKFLEVRYEKGMIEFHSHPPVAEMYSEPQHNKIFQPLSSDSIGKWKKNLPEAEQLVQPRIKLLKKWGYG